jgi:FMN phosphatase YigB (HAD superfamily)
MLKSLYPQVDWDAVRVVGLDLDGTLYDEADFIDQVYRPIAAIIAAACGSDPGLTHERLLRRWLEKGSSYPRIFEESLAEGGVEGPRAAEVIRRCVDTFRAFEPSLTLPPRVRTILHSLRERFPLLLITDGSERLQHRKIESLGLGRWFESGNIAVSGQYGAEYAKPAALILTRLALCTSLGSRRELVYFGDRDVDERFAADAGCQFVRVACMRPVNTRVE